MALGALVVVIGIVVLAASGSKSLTPGQSARTYIESVQGDASEVQDAVRSVPLAIALTTSSPRRTELRRLAQDAETAYEEIDSVHDSFGTNRNGTLGTAQAEVHAAASGLRNAMRSFVTYAQGPSPAARAQATSAYQSAVAEWNRGTEAIWRIAGLPGAPTL